MRAPPGAPRSGPPGSQDDECVATRISPPSKSREAGARADTEPSAKLLDIVDHDAVVPRGCGKQDDARRAQIALLRGDHSLQRLNVIQVRLGPDEDLETCTLDDRISAAMITRDRDRNLRAPTQTGVDPLAKTPEKREVSTVPHGIAGRVQTDSKLQTHDRGDTSDEIDREGGFLTPQRPLDSVRAHAEPPSQLSRAEAGGAARVVEFDRGPGHELTTPTSPTLDD